MMASAVQRLVAAGGAAAGAAGLWGAMPGPGPAAGWVISLFVCWCVLTPYWWFLEWRWLRPPGHAAATAFDRAQLHSFAVWLGVALAMAVLILRRDP